MRVIGLISGGKDSITNLMKCVHYKHQIVALANLQPVASKDEIDSYMYQSVGHELIDAMAECMQLPLYRDEIRGDAACQSLHYSQTEQDEVEDLYRLLARVKSQHPDANAVSCGTILSSYQRIRVEHVCQRLGLVCLAYLWQRDQQELLQEMIDDNIDAVIVKVAAMGLNRSHLGQTLRELQPTLLKLESEYGVNVCGEGGEFESITLDCPLFSKRIVIDHADVVVHSDDYYAPVLYWRCSAFHLEPKTDFVRSNDELATQQTSSAFVRTQIDIDEKTTINVDTVHANVVHDGDWLSINNLHCSEQSLTTQIKTIFAFVDRELLAVNMNRSHVRFVALRLHTMSQYAQLNDVYNTLFGADPPARSCVADANVVRVDGIQIDVLATTAQADTLHVQSVSEWAPACIGPYSQGTRVADVCLLAGQIALEPATMTLDVDANAAAQMSQAERNCSAVARLIDASIDRNDVSSAVRRAVVFYTDAAQVDVREALAERQWANVAALRAVTGLPKNALIELQWIVAKNKDVFERIQHNRAFDCFWRL